MYWIKDENKAWNVLSERVVPYISSLLPVGLHLTMGDFAFSAAIGQFISRGLNEAQRQKIENRMHLPKQFEIYFIWAAKLNIAIKPRREWLLYWGMDWQDGGRQGGGPRREGRQDEMVLRMFYVEHSCLQVGSVLGGKKSNHGLWQKYFHKEKIGKRERDDFYIAYFLIPWIFGFIKFNLALTVTWELQGQILAENVSFGARWNFKTATLWQTNWFFAKKKLNTPAGFSASKAEYSSCFFRFMITPSAMNSFLKIWEQFCDLSNLGSRVVARIDWGVCMCDH